MPHIFAFVFSSVLSMSLSFVQRIQPEIKSENKRAKWFYTAYLSLCRFIKRSMDKLKYRKPLIIRPVLGVMGSGLNSQVVSVLI